ncbi:MAG TPA: glycosyltransferase [Thermoanaerobaculia bacterium]|nr:glycosyltransferase [Thermoanaerobaculia bacterium]
MSLVAVTCCAAAYLALLGAKALLALGVARREERQQGSDGSGVAIAQPILAGDPQLATVLAANLEELPAAQFLWLIDEDDPEAQAVCRELADRHPERRIDVLVCPPPPEGCNPKLWKLDLARPAIREAVLLVLDDDTRMPAETLAALVQALDDHQLATSLPGYLDDGRLPSRLLAQFVDNNAALLYLPLLPFLPPLTINGMAYALRTEGLEAQGGFAPLLRCLTDDLAVAERTLGDGGRIFQSARPHWVETTVRDGRHYVQLLHRWFLFALLLLRKQPPGLRALIAVLGALPPLLLGALLVSFALAPSGPAAGILVACLALRALGLVAIQRSIYGRPLHAPFSSLVSELLQPLHLLHALVWRRIVWRTRHYRVHDDRRFETVR